MNGGWTGEKRIGNSGAKCRNPLFIRGVFPREMLVERNDTKEKSQSLIHQGGLSEIRPKDNAPSEAN